MTSLTPNTLWSVVPDAALRLHCWDGECVLYHGASGNTHRVPELVGKLLQCLLDAPASAGEISTAIDLHPDDVVASLHALVQLDIVEMMEAMQA